MQPTITPLDASLGATITDIDLADLDETTWSIVEDAFHEYAALIFPNQHLTEEAQIAFANLIWRNRNFARQYRNEGCKYLQPEARRIDPAAC